MANIFSNRKKKKVKVSENLGHTYQKFIYIFYFFAIISSIK